MDERVNCMACLVIGDDRLVPAVAVIDGITHALATTTKQTRHYALCDFNKNKILVPGAYYGRLVSTDRISWTDQGRPCLPGKQG